MSRIVILCLMTLGLGACSSALDYTSSVGEQQQVRRIGPAITPLQERKRLIEDLTRAHHRHRSDAIREIEAR